MPDTLTPEKVEQLVGGIEQATKALEEGRAKMDAANQEVGKLLKEQEELKAESATKGEQLKQIEKRLGELADKMETVANSHTDLTNRVRTQMKTLGHDGGDERQAFVWRNPRSRGTIFTSHQEAVELGMFFMATMKREGAARTYARQWLKERGSAGELRYMPNFPTSFLQDFGREWIDRVDQAIRQQSPFALQDLAGGATPGSILVRPEFSSSLLRNVEEHGVFRQDALVWPMGSDTVYIPRRSGGLTVYWEGEGDPGAETDPTFQLLGMTAKKMMLLHQYSSELSEDAAIELADILMFEIALAIATEEDRIGFNGDGSGGNSPGFAGYVGLLGAAANATAATCDSTFVPFLVTGDAGADLTTEITEAKLRTMTGLLHTWAQNAKWYMHRSVHADCDGIQMGTAGGSVVRYQDGKSASIMGYPIRHVEAMPVSPSAASTKVLALGDLRKSWILGDRRRVEVQTSEHYAFNTDQLTVRATARSAFLMQHGNGMVVYKTGTA